MMLIIATDLTLVCRLTLNEKMRTTVNYVWQSSKIAVVGELLGAWETEPPIVFICDGQSHPVLERDVLASQR